jgi:hypothetical protein
MAPRGVAGEDVVALRRETASPAAQQLGGARPAVAQRREARPHGLGGRRQRREERTEGGPPVAARPGRQGAARPRAAQRDAALPHDQLVAGEARRHPRHQPPEPRHGQRERPERRPGAGNEHAVLAEGQVGALAEDELDRPRPRHRESAPRPRPGEERVRGHQPSRLAASACTAAAKGASG